MRGGGTGSGSGLFVIGPVLLTLGLALFAFYTEAAELVPALKSVWLVIHVIVAMLAVGVLTRLLGRHRLPGQARREASPPGRRTFVESLPAAATLERTAYGLNMVGFILWTFTLIAGAIWAQKAWGAYWTWDPKEVWTFVIWVVYAAYMHARATAGWEPRKATWIALAGYVCVIMNFTVVNLFFVGHAQLLGAEVGVSKSDSTGSDPTGANATEPIPVKSSSVLRYTVLRLLIFFGCLLAFWLLGLRRPDQQLMLLVLAALSSVVLSYFLLRRERNDFSQRIADRVDQRATARTSGRRRGRGGRGRRGRRGPPTPTVRRRRDRIPRLTR